MVFYKNIETGHPYKKIWSIVPEILEFRPEVIIVAGAQFREEIKALVEGSDIFKWRIILVEYRKEEAEKWIIILQEDFDKIERILLPVLKGKRIFLYDNLCGGPRRIPFWKKWMSMDNLQVLAYLTKRHGTLKKLEEEGLKYLIKSKLDSMNYLIKLSKKIKMNSTSYKYLTPVNKEQLSSRVKEVPRCSFCGKPSSSANAYLDDNGILHCGYCDTSAPPVITERIKTMFYYIERKGLKCPFCKAYAPYVSIRKNGKRYRCSKCGHEWNIEERLDFEERKEEFLNHPIMSKYLQINKEE